MPLAPTDHAALSCDTDARCNKDGNRFLTTPEILEPADKCTWQTSMAGEQDESTHKEREEPRLAAVAKESGCVKGTVESTPPHGSLTQADDMLASCNVFFSRRLLADLIAYRPTCRQTRTMLRSTLHRCQEELMLTVAYG